MTAVKDDPFKYARDPDGCRQAIGAAYTTHRAVPIWPKGHPFHFPENPIKTWLRRLRRWWNRKESWSAEEARKRQASLPVVRYNRDWRGNGTSHARVSKHNGAALYK